MIATFLAFSAFPVAVALGHDAASLVVAFVIGGLREVGEPARKAMIVDLVQPVLRARSVGLYYLIRSLAIAPAAFVGGVLWQITPAFRSGSRGASASWACSCLPRRLRSAMRADRVLPGVIDGK